MIADWVFVDNLRAFLTVLGWLVGYSFCEDDWAAISFGVHESDGDADRWYEYEFAGKPRAKLRLARDAGTDLVQLRVEIPPEIEREVKLAVAIFQQFHVRGSSLPGQPRD